MLLYYRQQLSSLPPAILTNWDAVLAAAPATALPNMLPRAAVAAPDVAAKTIAPTTTASTATNPLHFLRAGSGKFGDVLLIASPGSYTLNVPALLLAFVTLLGINKFMPAVSTSLPIKPFSSAIRHHWVLSPSTVWAILRKVSPARTAKLLAALPG